MKNKKKQLFANALFARARSRKPNIELKIEELESRGGTRKAGQASGFISRLSKTDSDFELPTMSGEPEFDEVRDY